MFIRMLFNHWIVFEALVLAARVRLLFGWCVELWIIVRFFEHSSHPLCGAHKSHGFPTTQCECRAQAPINFASQLFSPVDHFTLKFKAFEATLLALLTKSLQGVTSKVWNLNFCLSTKSCFTPLNSADGAAGIRRNPLRFAG